MSNVIDRETNKPLAAANIKKIIEFNDIKVRGKTNIYEIKPYIKFKILLDRHNWINRTRMDRNLINS